MTTASFARAGESLFDAARRAAAAGIAGVGGVFASEEDRIRKEEADLLAQVTQVQKPSLVSAKEHAWGIRYSEPLETDWRPTGKYRSMPAAKADAVRRKYNILVEGEAIPPPIKSFADMRFPPPILEALAAKGINRPTPIQVQGLPVALSGRDMIGIAFTGSGKTMVFTLPMVMFALQEEARMPLARGEGPIGIILVPARELARQTYEGVLHFTKHLAAAGHPELRVMLATGGVDSKAQLDIAREGVHMVVATPGRLSDFLQKKRLNLQLCKYIVLDEGDRMLDAGEWWGPS